jgi:2'-5' RNA ligase
LVLVPHEALRNRIRDLRQEFNASYGMETQSKGRCSILLCSFTQYELMEEKIRTRLKTLAMGATPFKVELQGFGSFPTHSILINVASRLPVQELVKDIRQQSQRLLKLNEDHKPHFVLEPHLTLAARLKPWQYEKAWQEYSQRHFSARFIADHMVLLRRPVGEFQYQIVESFQFENMPVATKQGVLFG